MGAASAALFFCVGDSDTITVRIRRYTMVKHIILWQFKDELTDDRKKELGNEIKEKLEALQRRIPGLVDIHVQADILPSSNADLMLDCSFTDEDALNGYAVYPDHVKIKDGIIAPNVKLRVCIDYKE